MSGRRAQDDLVLHPGGRPARVRLLTLHQAGAYLGISTWTLRELIWRGTLPAVRITRKIHLDLRDLDEFIERAKERGGVAGSH